MLAIRAACAELGSERLTGLDLYVTLEPCAMCAAAIAAARIARLSTARPTPSPAASSTARGSSPTARPTTGPRSTAASPSSEAAALLRAFFAERR